MEQLLAITLFFAIAASIGFGGSWLWDRYGPTPQPEPEPEPPRESTEDTEKTWWPIGAGVIGSLLLWPFFGTFVMILAWFLVVMVRYSDRPGPFYGNLAGFLIVGTLFYMIGLI